MWRWFYAIRARLRALVGGTRSDRDLNDELSFHVAMQTHANEARGMSSAGIRTESHGETDLAKATPDGVREPLNRRTAVTITFRP